MEQDIIIQEAPQIIQELGNGKYLYNFNIIEHEDGTYSYITVKVDGKPEYKNCVKAVIRYYIDECKEFSLINEYNYAVLTGNPEDATEYREYLNLIKFIKDTVRKDLISYEKV